MKNIAVILAGGKGSRMGVDIPKQFLTLPDGRTVLETCISAFHQNEHIDEIAVVMLQDHFEQARTLITGERYPKVRYWIPGGKERWESSLHAIEAINGSINQSSIVPREAIESSINHKSSINGPIVNDISLLIHDCARPFISQDLISRACLAMLTHTAATVAVPVTDTIYTIKYSPSKVEGVAPEEAEASETILDQVPPRALFRRAQTPQCFRLSLMKKAFDLAMRDEERQFTDDAQVVQRYLPEVEIHIIPGEESNRKITFAEDIQPA